MQTIVLKNLNLKGVRLIGGTSLVIGYDNPRFSEDIDLTGVSNAQDLRTYIERARKMLEAFLGGDVKVTSPKAGKNTWRIVCRLGGGLGAKLHVDSQPYKALSQYSLVVEYPGVPPFVFPSIEKDEIMADKLVALAFRNNISGRDIFDLWYHWLKNEDLSGSEELIKKYVVEKLSLRSLKREAFLNNIQSRLKKGIDKRIMDEWERYLPAGLKNDELYKQAFSTVKKYLESIKL